MLPGSWTTVRRVGATTGRRGGRAAIEHHFALVAARNLLTFRDELKEGWDLSEHLDRLHAGVQRDAPPALHALDLDPPMSVSIDQQPAHYRSGRSFAARNPHEGQIGASTARREPYSCRTFLPPH
jgi:hypothetical protein